MNYRNSALSGSAWRHLVGNARRLPGWRGNDAVGGSLTYLYKCRSFDADHRVATKIGSR
jgi:hypothetical protein